MTVEIEKSPRMHANVRAYAPARDDSRTLVDSLRAYAELVRFRYHASFAGVVVGALVAADRRDASLLVSLALLYVFFNVLLYGGIYATNAVTDADSDGRHPGKRSRPVPSGRISAGSAKAFALVAGGSGLWGGWALFGDAVAAVFVGFVAINLFYSLFARDIPYLELVVNSATHPLRFVLGVVVVDGGLPVRFGAGVFLFALGLAAVRRLIEKDVPGWEARHTLRAYSNGGLRATTALPVVGLAGLWVADTAAWPFYASMLAAYAVLAFGVDVNRPLRRAFVALYTR
jgi:4-hydroxybenzoate polyprenyltransferase